MIDHTRDTQADATVVRVALAATTVVALLLANGCPSAVRCETNANCPPSLAACLDGVCVAEGEGEGEGEAPLRLLQPSFATVQAREGQGALRLVEEGFEQMPTTCGIVNGSNTCITGGFVP